MLPANTFEGKVAVITGGGTGIGLEIARKVAAAGGRVVIASRSREHLEPSAQSINEQTGRDDTALFHEVDVRDPESVETLASFVMEELGRVDILVNNAAGNFIVKAEELTPNGWNAVIGIVLNGTFFCSSAFGRRMISQGEGGSILNVIANYAWTGGPGLVHSASAKAGVMTMTQTLAVEWARYRIRVNAIAPGPVHTPGASEKLFPNEQVQEGIRRTIPLRRFANLDEVANAAAYLVSDFASFVTGEKLVIDGGQWLSGSDYWGRIREMTKGEPG
ncbi:MAG: SDR family oxidoreductase [Acidobacteria bacterium]|nr:SDR family oxidoreductase [Acidobacteriota bacterium]